MNAVGAAAPVTDAIGAKYIENPNTNPEAVVSQYREQAAGYDAMMKKWQFLTPEQGVQILTRFVSKDAKILEAGCGTGLSGAAQYEAGFGNLNGIDISPEMLAVARTKGAYKSLVEGNLLDPLPYPDNSFDAVECLAVFTHIVEVEPVLCEFHRIVKAGGLIIFSQRKDLYKKRNMSLLLDRLEGDGLFKKVHQSDWLPYVTNHADYIAHNITVGYFVFQKL